MMNTIAPVWDGNETWLVLGGNALLACFPLAFAVLMPALYLPILLMLIALILRGVAFEFRFRARARGRSLWTALFAGGSVGTAFAQGLILGGFIKGVEVVDGRFAGGPLDWLTPYTVLIALGVTAGYALLGAAWIILKTEDELHGDARRWGWIAGAAVRCASRGRQPRHPLRPPPHRRALGLHRGWLRRRDPAARCSGSRCWACSGSGCSSLDFAPRPTVRRSSARCSCSSPAISAWRSRSRPSSSLTR
jgi:hypothetical protein